MNSCFWKDFTQRRLENLCYTSEEKSCFFAFIFFLLCFTVHLSHVFSPFFFVRSPQRISQFFRWSLWLPERLDSAEDFRQCRPSCRRWCRPNREPDPEQGLIKNGKKMEFLFNLLEGFERWKQVFKKSLFKNNTSDKITTVILFVL